MKGQGLRRMALVISVCAVVGAVAGIAGSAAAPSKSNSAQAQKKKAQAMRKAFRHGMKFGFRAGGPGPGMMGGRGGPVHGEAVVPNADGTGFDTITTDAGTLNGVDGTTVDIKEGTDKKTYKDSVTIDVGSDAKVIRNHQDAKLSDLKQGDHVRVIQAPKGNVVIAEDDAFIAQEQKDHRGWGHHGMGPGGPPPMGPGAYPGPPPAGSNQNGADSGGGDAGNSNS